MFSHDLGSEEDLPKIKPKVIKQKEGHRFDYIF